MVSILNRLFNSKVFRTAFSLAFWFGVWQLAAAKVGQELLLPAPLVVLKRLGELALTVDFYKAVGITMLRVCAGFTLGAAAGSILAALCAFSKAADSIISPLLRIVRSTPVQSFIILALLWIKYPIIPVFISMLMVTPVVWGNVKTGIENVDKGLLELTKAYNFSFWRCVKLLYIPSIEPYFFSGCLTALGMAWKSAVAAEVLVLPKGSVGTFLYYSKIYLETPDLFAWTAAVIVLSFIWEKALSAFFKALQKEKRRIKF